MELAVIISKRETWVTSTPHVNLSIAESVSQLRTKKSSPEANSREYHLNILLNKANEYIVPASNTKFMNYDGMNYDG